MTGQLRVTILGGERIQAFIPNPLPPDPPLELTAARQRLLERANLALGRLDSVSLLLPDVNIFLHAYVRREAVLSSQIEGTQSSLADLLLFERGEVPGVPLDDVTKVSNYVQALEHGIEQLRAGFPLCNRLIRDMHAILLSSGKGSERSPGEFRRSQNWIGGTRPGDAHFVPPPPDEIENCMAALERFLHNQEVCPALVKAALAHVQFETIHPFLDGNGRTGRLLIAFILHHEAVLQKPLLYMSLFFKRHREQYYGLLDSVRWNGDWEAWLDFFLTGVEETATNAVETAQRLVALFKADERRIPSLGRSASTVLRVFQAMCQNPVLTIKDVCERTGLSFPAANKAMDGLVKLGVAQEFSGKRRNRVFAYEQYVRILSEGTEAL